MKIIVINGSPRTNGLTASVLHLVENELISQGIDVEYYDLIGLDIGHCLGCCSCYMTGHCFIKDDAERLSQKVKNSDGLVLGSPTYASNVSGLMKDFIDRGHFVIEQLLKDKYCITVATGENHGFKNTLKILNDLVIYTSGNLCGHIALKAAFNSKRHLPEKTLLMVRKAVKRVASKKKDRLQILYHRLIFSIGIKPFVMRKGKLYQGVINRWSDIKIIKELPVR